MQNHKARKSNIFLKKHSINTSIIGVNLFAISVIKLSIIIKELTKMILKCLGLKCVTWVFIMMNLKLFKISKTQIK